MKASIIIASLSVKASIICGSVNHCLGFHVSSESFAGDGLGTAGLYMPHTGRDVQAAAAPARAVYSSVTSLRERETERDRERERQRDRERTRERERTIERERTRERERERERARERERERS